MSFLNEVFSPAKRDERCNNFKVLIITYCDKDADDLLYRIETMNKKGKIYLLVSMFIESKEEV